MKELTREEALRLHRQMWSDMKKELGDCPSCEQRRTFKQYWCLDHTPENMPHCNCFLCEYTKQIGKACECCPIDLWSKWGCVNSRVDYRYSPISEILALPERKDTDNE